MHVAALILGLALFAIALSPSAALPQSLDFSGVDAAATDAVASGEIPGVVVLVGRGEDILFHRAWGSRAVVPQPLPMLRVAFSAGAGLPRDVFCAFRDKFGVDPEKRFAEPLQRLKDWGFLTVEGDSVLLNRDGLLQVDRLLHEFFLPQHKTNRYV